MEGLIGAGGHQGVVDLLEPAGGGALDDERIGRVEAAAGGAAQGAPLGSVGIGVGQVIEVRRQCRIVVERQRMHRGHLVEGVVSAVAALAGNAAISARIMPKAQPAAAVLPCALPCSSWWPCFMPEIQYVLRNGRARVERYDGASREPSSATIAGDGPGGHRERLANADGVPVEPILAPNVADAGGKMCGNTGQRIATLDHIAVEHSALGCRQVGEIGQEALFGRHRHQNAGILAWPGRGALEAGVELAQGVRIDPRQLGGQRERQRTVGGYLDERRAVGDRRQRDIAV